MTTLRLPTHRILALVATLVALLVSVPALAQTAGQIRGTVVDTDDFGVPRVTLTLEGETLIGGAQTKESDGNGNFFFVELPPGTYKLRAEKDGFTTSVYDGIQVNVGRTTNQKVVLQVTSEEVIEVEGTRPVVDVEDTSRGQVLTKEFLERIPTGRSYQSAVQMANGVVGGSNPNMGGGAFNENTYMLDGATITDPVTGTFSLNFNYDAIQQVEVLLGGMMPEYGQSLGGIVNLVTESGTNNLEFDTSVFYTNGNWRNRRDARWTADGFQLAPTDFDSEFQLIQVAGKVSGPIVRDRAWFILSYQHSRSLIANTGIPLPRDFDGHYVLGKLTVQPTSEHRLTAFIQLNPTSIDNGLQSDIFVKPDAQLRQYQGGAATQFRWQWFLGSEANLDTQVVIQKSFLEIGSVPCTHNRDLGYHPCRPGEPEGDEDWTTPGRIGTFGAYDSVAYPVFQFDDRIRYQASSKLTLLSLEDPLGGTHDFKAGIEGVQTIWDRLVGYNGNLYYVDVNAVGWDPLSFQNYYRWETSGPIAYRTSGSQWNFFIQDSWKPISNLVIKGGIRYDNSVMRNDVGDPVVAQSLWGPRLYASWDPFGDQKTKIAGGFGRFNDAGRLAVANFARESSFGSKLWLGELFAGGQGDFASSQDTMYQYAPRENPAVAHDTLRAPRADEVSLIIQREIIRDVGIETQGVYRNTRFIFEPDETNLIYDQDGSAVIGSRLGIPNISYARMRTPALARRDYVQWDTSLYKVFSRRWFARATYTYTLSYGTSTQSLSGSFMNDPQTQYNYGPVLQTDIRHVVKAFGSWQLPTDPWNQTLGFTFEYYSGRPLERFYPNEGIAGGGYGLRIRPRGLYTRFPPEWIVGLKFVQDIDVRKGKLKLDAQLLNAFNNRAPIGFLGAFYSENRLLATARQDPLRIQLGVQYQF